MQHNEGCIIVVLVVLLYRCANCAEGRHCLFLQKSSLGVNILCRCCRVQTNSDLCVCVFVCVFGVLLPSSLTSGGFMDRNSYYLLLLIP